MLVYHDGALHYDCMIVSHYILIPIYDFRALHHDSDFGFLTPLMHFVFKQGIPHVSITLGTGEAGSVMRDDTGSIVVSENNIVISASGDVLGPGEKIPAGSVVAPDGSCTLPGGEAPTTVQRGTVVVPGSPGSPLALPTDSSNATSHGEPGSGGPGSGIIPALDEDGGDGGEEVAAIKGPGGKGPKGPGGKGPKGPGGKDAPVKGPKGPGDKDSPVKGPKGGKDAPVKGPKGPAVKGPAGKDPAGKDAPAKGPAAKGPKGPPKGPKGPSDATVDPKSDASDDGDAKSDAGAAAKKSSIVISGDGSLVEKRVSAEKRISQIPKSLVENSVLEPGVAPPVPGRTSEPASAAVQLPDGSVVQELVDGSVVQQLPDGSIVQKLPDGSTLESLPDGSVLQKILVAEGGDGEAGGPGGATGENGEDGKKEGAGGEGKIAQIQQLQDGSIIQQKPDGSTSVVQKLEDGSIVEQKDDGTLNFKISAAIQNTVQNEYIQVYCTMYFHIIIV
jgi:hypothetical protein